MGIAAQNSAYVFVGTATTGGTAPGGASPPTGCTISGTTADVSAWAYQVKCGDKYAMLDATVFGLGGFASWVRGIKSADFEISFFQDFAAASINVLLGPNGTISTANADGSFFIEVRGSSAVRSATNPGFIAKVLYGGSMAFDAKAGDLAQFSITLQQTGGFAELIA